MSLRAALLVFALAPAARAQVNFFARVDGASEVPPTPSVAIGRAHFMLDLDTRHLHYRVETNVAGAVSAWIRNAPSGANGPMVFPLTGGPVLWYGISPTLSDAQLLELHQSELYVQIATGAFPGGEIRGQIRAQSQRFTSAALTGAEAGTASTGTGTGNAHLDVQENVVIARLTAGGLGAPTTAAHLHVGLLTIPLTPVDASTWGATTPALTQAQVDDLLLGNAFFDVHTTAFPGGLGEIRGKVAELAETFVATCSGTQELPPNASANTAFGRFSLNPATRQITYSASWTGVGGAGAQMRMAVPGMAGPVVFPLAGPANGPWAGVSPVLPPATVAEIWRYGLHLNVPSAAVPAGEVRGALVQNPNVFGYCGTTAAGILGRRLRITSVGVPTLGNAAFRVGLGGGDPGAFASLAWGADRVGTPLLLDFVGAPGHDLWLDPLGGFANAVDAAGEASMLVPIPPGPPGLVGQDLFFQWFSIEAAANPAGLVFGDALRITVQ
ncbi:MAG TPA: CHRD domain-containing protein [Planctomycetota bacterium]|nr:CHRD domain-containing protein [Planctomycetota bacterium]